MPDVDLIPESIHGSCAPVFAPTHARLTHRKTDKAIKWNTRNHRKQRYRTVSPQGSSRDAHGLARRSFRIFRFEYWNVSWWVGFMFTIGSIVWVVNGFQVWSPFVTSISANSSAAGWSAFVGATIFFFGSILLVIEAWNRDETALFGAVLKHSFIDFANSFENGLHRRLTHTHTHTHTYTHAQEKPKLLLAESAKLKDPKGPQDWIWFSFDPKFFHEIGFVAGFIQFWAATIFWISGFAGIAQITSALTVQGTASLDGVFWVPQVIGGTGFIVSSLLYMLEAQKKWYLPRPLSLGWHAGFWNFVGGIGFTACAAFGFSEAHWAQYQSTLCTFWGSWAFLIGSVIQWYESVNLTHQMHHITAHNDNNGVLDGDKDSGAAD